MVLREGEGQERGDSAMVLQRWLCQGAACRPKTGTPGGRGKKGWGFLSATAVPRERRVRESELNRLEKPRTNCSW